MLDVSVSYNRYKFLGFEFLTWVWFTIESDSERLNQIIEEGSLQIGNRIKLENRQHQLQETITIKGDDAGLEEGILSLRKGAVVTELNLIYTADSHVWQFTIKGESLGIGNLKPPATGPAQGTVEMEGKLLEKTYLVGEVSRVLDNLFRAFVMLRISNRWADRSVPQIREWISS